MVGALTSFGTGSGDAENQEVRLVGGEERLDARLPVTTDSTDRHELKTNVRRTTTERMKAEG